MTAYQDLGPSQVLTAAADPGNKFAPGNWTVQATADKLKVRYGLVEVYQIAILAAPVGSSFTLYRNQQFWNYVFQGWANNYDPFNPLYLRQGDSLFFYYNTAVAPAPQLVIWMRYDADNPSNKYTAS